MPPRRSLTAFARPVGARLLLPLLLALVGACASAPPTPAASTQAGPGPELAAPAPPARPTPARIVAVGDLHGDTDATLAVLQLAGVVDAQGHWSGGQATLVQTGDMLDRGLSSKGVVALLQRLQAEAPASGGQVVVLLGNHEAMNLQGDWRYVSPEDLNEFGGEQARREALSAQGALGSWLRQRDAATRIGDTVFVHGGLRPAWAAMGTSAVSAQVRAALDGAGSPMVLGPEGPLWYRGYVQEPEVLACKELGEALTALGARRMVVGHTTQRNGRILSRCGGQLLAIDTGISAHYGRNLAALELRSGDAWGLYPAGPEDLPDP